MRSRSVCGFQPRVNYNPGLRSCQGSSAWFFKIRLDLERNPEKKNERAAAGRRFFFREGYARPVFAQGSPSGRTHPAKPARKKTRPRRESRRRAHTQNKAGASFSTERKGQETIWAYERFPEKRDRVSGLPEPGKRKPEPRDRPTKAARPEEENRNGARAEDTPGQQEAQAASFRFSLIGFKAKTEERPKRKQDPEGRLLSAGFMPERQAVFFAPGFRTLSLRTDPGSEKTAEGIRLTGVRGYSASSPRNRDLLEYRNRKGSGTSQRDRPIIASYTIFHTSCDY